MIDQVDGRLKTWVESVLSGVPVSFAPPSNSATDKGVSLYLLELASVSPVSPTGGQKRAPLQFQLRYLVTTWGSDPQEAHRLLADLLFAALESTDFDVDLEPLPPTIWSALGALPRPAFVLHLPLRKERPEPLIPLVLKPLVVQASPVTSLRGVVLSPDNIPITGARVELADLQVVEHTDRKGSFVFSAVPAEPRSKQLVITAKGREKQVRVDLPASNSDPVVIRFDPREE